MTDIIERLRAAVPTYEGTPIAWPCEVRSELLLEAAAEVERLTRERDEARAALRPFSEFYLWPDDSGEWTANDVRSDEDWDEERNDAKVDDVLIKRAHIRAARKALEAKP